MAIIEVKHLTKEYKLGALTGIKDSFRQGLAKITGKETWDRERFKALDDVSFSIEEGEVVGIIGHNGAGKSTLLKHLAKITTATHGEVHVGGSVAPLIEVGAGLNPELTGRENIYLNGAILGIPKREIEKKLDEIIDFSELKRFIDTPVKRYSSGMTVKLGFSIATSLDADILIVDEVLAVGDLAFQRKCFDRMEELIKRSGKTVLIVSHNIRQIQRLCDRAILLSSGKVVLDDEKTKVCEEFYRISNKIIAGRASQNALGGQNVRSTGIVTIESLDLIDESGQTTEEFEVGSSLTIRCVFKAKREIVNPEIHLGFHTTDFFYISSMGDGHLNDRPDIVAGVNTVECHIDSLPLMPGVFAIRLSILDGVPSEVFYGEMLKTFSVFAKEVPQSKLPAYGVVFIPSVWRYNEACESKNNKQRV